MTVVAAGIGVVVAGAMTGLVLNQQQSQKILGQKYELIKLN